MNRTKLSLRHVDEQKILLIGKRKVREHYTIAKLTRNPQSFATLPADFAACLFLAAPPAEGH
jgi:hypothetical protein